MNISFISRKNIRHAVALAFCSIAILVEAQENVKTFGLNYYGERINEKAICNQFYNFKTKEIALKAVDEIVRRSGLRRNFYIMECPNTDNCFAAVQGSTRLIVYDASFMKKANDLAKTDWGALSILAHEIGHHLQGHTIVPGGSDPNKELEADEFSGFVLYQMGASVKEAQAAISKLTSDYDGGTHPPRNKRLASIEKGWKNAQELYPNVKKSDGSILSGNTSKTEPQQVPEPPIQKIPEPTPRRQPAPNNGTIDTGNVDKSVDNHNYPPKNQTDRANHEPEVGVLSTNDVDNSTNSSKKGGCIEGNCTNGIGKMVNSRTEELYHGEWRNGKREGKGTEYYADGSKKYVGNFSQSKYSGNGTYYFKNGDSYIGKFKNGLMHDDKGYFIFANHTRLVAKMVEGKKQGKAMRIYQDGRREDTYFENDIER
jgi:hypothetical protein